MKFETLPRWHIYTSRKAKGWLCTVAAADRRAALRTARAHFGGVLKRDAYASERLPMFRAL